MNEAERTAWVIERLGNDAIRDDLILELCRLEGWDWPQAEAWVEQVAQLEAAHIARHKAPWLLILSAGALVLGLVQSGWSYYFIFYPLLRNLHEPLTLPLAVQTALSVPLFLPQMIAGLGLGVGGLIGLIHTLQGTAE